ncbi:MAG: hypothetical protein WA765_02565 [Candidatus Acidiferrum sp.]
MFHICQNGKGPVHVTVTRYQPTPQEQGRRRKEKLAERVEKESRVHILDSIREKLPDSLTQPDFEMVALDYFPRLGHDGQRRLSKVHGWGKKKTKVSWGGETVDYEKIGANAIAAMSTPNLQQFLVVCGLVSDLMCPGYSPSQPLAKDSNPARTAVRYKIDIAKVAATVRAEFLQNKESKRKEETSNPAASVTSVQRDQSKAKPAK